MRAFIGYLGGWLRRIGIYSDPIEVAVRRAHFQLNRIVQGGTNVPDDIAQPILKASEAVRAGQITVEVEQAFYGAYARLTKLAPLKELEEDGDAENPLRDALDDAGLLLKYAAETGVQVSRDIVEPILVAGTAYKAGELNDAATANFYDAYSRLAQLFGEVTADTIRNCSSPQTRATLARNRFVALSITAVIATVSVLTFVADSMSKGVLQDLASANSAAATLRAGLTPGGANASIDARYAQNDPCSMIQDKPLTTDTARSVQNTADVQQLQEFAITIRDLRGRAIKLNWFVRHWECDPFDPTGKCPVPGLDNKSLNTQLQLNPAILNYTAEVLCKIKTYQLIRTFATNVQMDYAAVVGAFASYALPIVYALLGAYAYRLRLFGETIRKEAYHPSFSDSARIITAVIAGAIAGLFNPAQGLSLSPLATAFLVGYGVELFFKFLDTLINAFGSSRVAKQ